MEEAEYNWFQSELGWIKRKLASQEIIARLGYCPKNYPVLRSQFLEDLSALEILGYQKKGTYVEVGGFDGRTFSVTSVFDDMGWEGVLIEPILQKHSESIRNRPNATNIYAAIGNRKATGEVEFTEVLGGGMFSGVGNDHKIDPQLQASTLPRRVVKVPFMSMDTALQGVWKEPVQIDLAVIDVEGNEVELLDGFSLDIWKPRLVIIEDNSGGVDKSIDPFFEADYFLLGHDQCNRYYGRKDDAVICRWKNPTA
jgi:FkbM family methyltransferase